MIFLKKGVKIYSILFFKCPKCQSGSFFTSTPYDLKNIAIVKDKCEECGLNFLKEPGFYFGALYVAYALAVALFVFLWVVFLLFFPALSDWIQILLISLSTFLLSPYLFSLSKIIWANMFFHFDSNALKKDKICQ